MSKFNKKKTRLRLRMVGEEESNALGNRMGNRKINFNVIVKDEP